MNLQFQVVSDTDEWSSLKLHEIPTLNIGAVRLSLPRYLGTHTLSFNK